MLECDNQQSGNLLHFLPSFGNLTHLSLGANFDGSVEMNDPAFPIISITKACPNLKSLRLTSAYPPVFFSNDDKKELVKIQQNQHLRSLSLCVPFIDMTQFMEYLTFQQLDTLELYLDRQDFGV